MSIVKQSLVGASGQGGGYTINDSLRFRSSASAYQVELLLVQETEKLGLLVFGQKQVL